MIVCCTYSLSPPARRLPARRLPARRSALPDPRTLLSRLNAFHGLRGSVRGSAGSGARYVARDGSAGSGARYVARRARRPGLGVLGSASWAARLRCRAGFEGPGGYLRGAEHFRFVPRPRLQIPISPNPRTLYLQATQRLSTTPLTSATRKAHRYHSPKPPPGASDDAMSDAAEEPEDETEVPSHRKHGHSDHILQFFASSHLPPSLRDVSRPFGDLAARIVESTPRNPERTVALRKLLEAKDAAVRAHLASS